MAWEGAPFEPGDEWNLIFTAKRLATDTDPEAVFQKESGAGITAVGSVASVEVIPLDTVNEPDSTLFCGIRATHLTTLHARTVYSDRLRLKQATAQLSVPSVPIYTTEPPDPYRMFAHVVSATPPDDLGVIWIDSETGDSSVWMETAWVVFSGAPSATAASIGLDQVDNTSDANKPVSDATQEAISGLPINVTLPPYSAVGDGARADVVSITSGSAILTCPSALWMTSHVGKYIRVEGAGVAGADLITTIASRQSNTQVTLGATASTTRSNAGSAFFGTNNTIAIQAALDDAALSPWVRGVYVPPGCYLGNWIMPQQVHFKGAYSGTITNILETPAQLANRQLMATVLMPAVTTSPVIYADEPTGMATGCLAQGFVVAGSAAKQGHGIRFGDVVGGTGFASGNARIMHCLVSGFAIGIANSNAVDGEIGHCVVNSSTIGYLINRHDGCFVHNVSATYCDTVFMVYGCKNLRVQTGNFNYMARCFDITDSHVSVGTINVEFPSAEVVALRQVGGTGSFTADFVQCLSAGDVTFVKDYFPEASKTQVNIDIKRVQGGTNQFFDTANTSYPTCIRGINLIRRYTDNTFATLNRTEKVRRVYLTPWEMEESTRTLKDEFARRHEASPYGDLGWHYSTIAGSYATPQVHESAMAPGTLLIASTGSTGVDAVRFWPSSTIMNPLSANYWKTQWILRLANTSSAIFRAGVYSTDVASLKPANGLGFRIDTSLGDSTIKLEILNAGTPTTVDTGIAISSLQTARRVVLQRTSTGVSLALFQSDGSTQLAPEVYHATALPAWAGYHRASVLTGVGSAVAQSIFLNQFLYTQYLGSEF